MTVKIGKKKFYFCQSMAKSFNRDVDAESAFTSGLKCIELIIFTDSFVEMNVFILKTANHNQS